MNELNNINQQIASINTQIGELVAEENQKLLDAERQMQGYLKSILESQQAKIQREYNAKISSLFNQASVLNNEYNLKNSLLNTAQTIIESECKALGYDNEQKRMSDRIKIREELQKQLQAQSCPVNSYYSNGKCSCNEGYVASGSVCITYSQNCQIKYGQNSYGDKQYCHCSAGYEFNSGKTTCLKTETPKNQENPPIKEDKQQQEQEQPNQQAQQIQPETKEVVAEVKQDKSEEVKTESENQDNKSEQQKKGILASISRFSANIYNAFKNIFSRILKWF